MKNQKNNALQIPVIVLGVITVLLIASCVLLKMQSSVPKLSPVSYEAPQIKERSDQEMEVTDSHDSFNVSKSSGKSTSEKTKEENGGETGDYLCSYSSERLMTLEDVNNLKATVDISKIPEGATVIQMVINELYAKNGYEFNTTPMKKYFAKKAWYKSIKASDRSSDQNAVKAKMTSIEQKNIDFLSDYR